MRFMMMMKPGPSFEAGVPPDPALIGAIGKLTAEMTQRGILVQTGGLLPSGKGGARVRVGDGKLVVTDGPFAETKELIGGFAVVEVASRDEALTLGRQFMEIHAAVLGPAYEGECEIRQMFDGATCADA
jgi:hypothetical protein